MPTRSLPPVRAGGPFYLACLVGGFLLLVPALLAASFLVVSVPPRSASDAAALAPVILLLVALPAIPAVAALRARRNAVLEVQGSTLIHSTAFGHETRVALRDVRLIYLEDDSMSATEVLGGVVAGHVGEVVGRLAGGTPHKVGDAVQLHILVADRTTARLGVRFLRGKSVWEFLGGLAAQGVPVARGNARGRRQALAQAELPAAVKP